MTRWPTTAPWIVALMAVLALVGCGERRPDAPPPTAADRADGEEPPATPVRWPPIDAWQPGENETYPNGKRLASRAALRAVTYPRGATSREVAARLPPAAVSTRALARTLAPVVDETVASTGEVVYPQLSGVTPSSLGAMVVLRQHMTSEDGPTRTVTRVLDVRLRRNGGPWQLDRVASVGGSPAPRPDELSGAARSALRNPRLSFSDSARWDVLRGGVDDGLLRALDRAAQGRRLSVGVLRSGHPPNVWETDRISAHTRGFAADIYAVDGQPVVDQQRPGGPAHALAGSFVAGGAAQVGSPWSFPPGGARSFTDEVHADHIHLQWTALP